VRQSLSGRRSATGERLRGTIYTLLQLDVMLEIHGEIVGGWKGRVDLARVFEQSVSNVQRAALLVGIGVSGPPLGFSDSTG